MSFQTEREMLSLERNRYIQVCRENEYAVLYYDNFVMVLVLFLVSMIALSAMAAATRPVLRAKLYQAYTRKNGD